MFSAPTRLPTGTRTSTKDSSAVSEQCQPIFSSRRVDGEPGRAVSIDQQARSPACPGPPVRTAVVTKSARTPLVMNVFDAVDHVVVAVAAGRGAERRPRPSRRPAR